MGKQTTRLEIIEQHYNFQANILILRLIDTERYDCKRTRHIYSRKSEEEAKVFQLTAMEDGKGVKYIQCEAKFTEAFMLVYFNNIPLTLNLILLCLSSL